jgi:predicted AAA+ superfamily ATPase
MAPFVAAVPALHRRLSPPGRSCLLLGPRGTGKSTVARQWFPEALLVDLRAGPLARRLAARPELLHEALDAEPVERWVVVDEISRIPALLDVVHQRLDREPTRRFLLTGSSARAVHRAGVNLLGGRAGRRTMPSFLAAELGPSFTVERAQRHGMLPVVWTAPDPAAALADYATVAVVDEVTAEVRVRQVAAFARALEQLALSHGRVLSPTAIAQQAEVAKSTVVDWIDVLESMLLLTRVPLFSRRPSRRALAAQPKLFFADTGVAQALLPSEGARTAPDAVGAAREGLVYQHLAAWCDGTRDARLATWRTTAGVEVDFVVEHGDQLVAVEVKTGSALRPPDRRGLLAFHDEFPEARLLLLAEVPLRERHGPIEVCPLGSWLPQVVPGEALP